VSERPVSAVLRVAGSARVGFGHVRRCWTLATRLAADGAPVTFVGGSPDMLPVLRAAGYTATVEGSPTSLAETIRVCRAQHADMCIVDDPRVSLAELDGVKRELFTACVDDLCLGDVPVDLVINGSVGAERLPYRGGPRTRFLLGASFVLLREAFAEVPARSRAGALRRVLVLVGGGDAGALPDTIARIIGETLPAVHIDVVIGPFASEPRWTESMRARITVHRAPHELRDLMLAADLAVSGGGQALYELAATATPTIAMQIAPDQRLNLQGLAAVDAIRWVAGPDDRQFVTELARTLAELARDAPTREAMGHAGRRLVDGRGTERVAAAVMSVCGAGVPR
jgi:spore coat polysaccharide biosynthesis predicted glycosyltransferase SpsG